MLFFLLVLVLSSSAVDVAQPYTLNQSRLEWWPTWLSVGTWNTMLQPWFEQEWADNVFNHFEHEKLDVLALQEIWTDEDVHKILNHPGRKRHYPHYHVPKARPNDRAGCDFSDATLAYLADNYLKCLIAYGIPTNTLMQPLVPVPIDCMTLAVGIGIEQYNPVNQLCLACLINTLEYLPVATADNGVAQQALATCGAGQGPKYGHRGSNGQVILSKHPLTKVSETQFDGFLVNRVNVHATIKGIKFGFGHFAYNVLADIDPSLAPLMYGALQKDHIQDFIDHKSDVVVGDMNSGPNYQPEGYDHFAANHYTHASPAENTWCKESHKDFLPCPLAGGPPALAIDHVMVRQGSHIYSFWGRQFNEYPVAMSDHVGVAVDLVSVHCSEGLTKAIEKIKAEKNRQ